MELTEREHRLVRQWLLVLLGMGLLLRLVRFALAMPIWGDEAMLGLSIIGRSYRDLLQPLANGQVAPFGFVWWLRFTFDCFGVSDYTTRLPALLAGIAALVLFWQWARLLVAPHAALLASGIVAVSWYVVRHGVEMKPYALDLLASVLLLLFATRYLTTGRRSSLVALLLLVPVCAVMSYPQIFTAAGIGVALIWSAWHDRSRNRYAAAFFCVIAATSFAAVFWLSAGAQYHAATQAALQDYWHTAFPPANPLKFIVWFVQIHTGNLFAYPIGGKNGASIVTVILFGIGLTTMWKKWTPPIRLMLATPFLFTFIAGAFRFYPYGDSARVSQHLALVIILVSGAGVAGLIDRTSLPATWRTRLHIAGAALLLVGAISLVVNWRAPYKTKADEQLRTDIRRLNAARGNAPVIVLQSKEQVPPTIRWYLNERPSGVEYGAANQVDKVRSAQQAYVINCDRTQTGLLPQLAGQSQMNATTWLQDDLQIGPRENGPVRLEIIRLAR